MERAGRLVNTSTRALAIGEIDNVVLNNTHPAVYTADFIVSFSVEASSGPTSPPQTAPSEHAAPV